MNVKLKNVLINSLTIFISISIAYLILEFFLSFSVYTTGSAQGLADKRWREIYWRPINTLGYRDYEINKDFKKKPTIVFLGDSFTSGHGVMFEETYYFLLRKRFVNEFTFINLGMNGASTKDENLNYSNFLKQSRFPSGIVVHQYFGNDIEDHIDFNKKIITSSWLYGVGQKLGATSELFSLVSSLIGGQVFGDIYVKKIEEAYSTDRVYLKHVDDVKHLHDEIRKNHSVIYFVVFPFLNSKDSIDLSSSLYIEKMKSYFLKNCKNGDVFFDVSGLVRTLGAKESTVSFLNSHASIALNKQLSDEIAKEIIGSNQSEILDSKNSIQCGKGIISDALKGN